ncbi:MAG: hypothetical protein ACRDDY_07930 [Clostridium sp.]|uniref:hypothetical protein n=1 Tax=Clostridium sp. TaxID=1506 RepID=UPI003EE799C8
MENINCWICGNEMDYKGIVDINNVTKLGKCHHWECEVCGEGIYRRVREENLNEQK